MWFIHDIERVAPQPLTPHQGERQRERDTERKKEERDKKETKEGGGRMLRDQRRKRIVWERTGTNGRREGEICQRQKSRRKGILLRIGGDKRGL